MLQFPWPQSISLGEKSMCKFYEEKKWTSTWATYKFHEQNQHAASTMNQISSLRRKINAEVLHRKNISKQQVSRTKSAYTTSVTKNQLATAFINKISFMREKNQYTSLVNKNKHSLSSVNKNQYPTSSTDKISFARRKSMH